MQAETTPPVSPGTIESPVPAATSTTPAPVKVIKKPSSPAVVNAVYVPKYNLRYTIFTGIISYQEKALLNGSNGYSQDLTASTVGVGIGISDRINLGRFVFGHELFVFSGQTDAYSTSSKYDYSKRSIPTAGATVGVGFFWTPSEDKGFSVGLVTDYMYKSTSWLSQTTSTGTLKITPKSLGVVILSLEGKYQYSNWAFYHKTGFSSGLTSMIWNVGVEHSL